jgi:hypothetical protein
VKKFVDKDGCEHCHTDDAWSLVRFDHSTTRFALEGKHATVDCRKCHLAGKIGVAGSALSFAKTAAQCDECHSDVHRAQFVNSIANRTDCQRCHSAQSWKAERFDHNRDARFKLDGAHRNVPCRFCHLPKAVGEAPLVAYKPLDVACKSCHSGADFSKEESKL